MGIFKNNKKASTGFAWIFGLVTLFGLGVLYIVFSQVFLAYLVPTIKGQVNSSNIDLATQTEINTNIDKYIDYFNIMPFILFVCVIIYLIVVSVRKERDSEFL